jgi:hypothetical protein
MSVIADLDPVFTTDTMGRRKRVCPTCHLTEAI